MISNRYIVERYNSTQKEWVKVFSSFEYTLAWEKYNSLISGFSGLGGDVDRTLYPEGFARIKVWGAVEERSILVSYQ